MTEFNRIKKIIKWNFLFICYFLVNPFYLFASVENGTIDLSEYSNSSTVDLSLKGRWDFFWEQIPSDQLGNFSTSNLKDKESLEIPGHWGVNNKPAFGYGSLHVKFTNYSLENAELYFADIRSAQEVWCNGIKIFDIDHSPFSPELSKPLLKSIYLQLPNENELDIYIIISNYAYRNHGRISGEVKLLSKEVAVSKTNFQITKSAFIATILFTLGLFSVLLYFLGVKRKVFLYFGITFIGGALRQAALNENLFLIAWEDAPAHFIHFLKFGSAYIAIGFGAYYFMELFPQDAFRRLNRVLAYICFVAFGAMLILPMSLNTYLLAPMLWVMLFTIVEGVVFTFIAAINKRRYSLISVLGLSVFLIGLINDILTSYEIITTPYLVAYFSILIGVLNVTIIITLFKESEQRAYELNQTVKNKSKDIELLAVDQVSNFDQQKKIITKLETLLDQSQNEASGLKQVINELKFQNKVVEKSTFEAENIDQINTEFINRLRSNYPDLTETEIEICSLIRVKLSNKEIAAYRGTTEDAVRVAKSRIRKKMKLAKNERLEAILKNLPE